MHAFLGWRISLARPRSSLTLGRLVGVYYETKNTKRQHAHVEEPSSSIGADVGGRMDLIGSWRTDGMGIWIRNHLQPI